MNFVKSMAVFGVMGWLVGMAPASVMADEGEALLTGKPCVACHSKDKKIVGPAFKDISAKYKGNADAAAILVAKIKSGGSGNWGPIPMPPNPTISDDDLHKIVAWILSL
jgi:cytochrome c